VGDLLSRHQRRQLLQALIGDLDRRHMLAASVAVLGVAGGQGVENGGLARLGRADDGEVHATPPFTAPRVRASRARGQGTVILGVYMTAERALPQLEADKLRDELNRFSGSVRIVTFLSPT
jgi:hypothetical protein